MSRDILLKVVDKVKKIRTAIGVLNSKVSGIGTTITVTKEITISANGTMSAGSATFTAPDGYKIISVITTIPSSGELLVVNLVDVATATGENASHIYFTVKNFYEYELTRNIVFTVCLMPE